MLIFPVRYSTFPKLCSPDILPSPRTLHTISKEPDDHGASYLGEEAYCAYEATFICRLHPPYTFCSFFYSLHKAANARQRLTYHELQEFETWKIMETGTLEWIPEYCYRYTMLLQRISGLSLSFLIHCNFLLRATAKFGSPSWYFDFDHSITDRHMLSLFWVFI